MAISHAPLEENVRPVGKRVFPTAWISTDFVVASAVLSETRSMAALSSAKI